MSYSPFADEFLDMMPRVVTLTPFVVTGNGQRIPGTARQYHAYVSSDGKAIYSATGQTVFSTSAVILHPKALDGTVLTAITPDAVLTLDDGTKPRILQIGSINDEDGICAWEVRT